MNFFEKLILALIAAAEAEIPIFIHSKQGMVVLNASENVVNAVAAVLSAPKTPPAPSA